MRIFHNYKSWEDWHDGLYATVYRDEQRGVQLASRLLGNPEVLGPAMLRVVTAWPVAAEVNLSNVSRNHQAWIGQACCSYFCGVPEFVTKMAWWTLTDDQRAAANEVADSVERVWVSNRTPQLEIMCQNES